MIVCEWFEGDDIALAQIQHDEYPGATQRLMQCLVHRVDDLAPELLPFLPIETYDHRDLQWLHDLLAARFRLVWLLEHKSSLKQATLFGENEVVNSRDFVFEWHNAIQEQLDALLVRYPNTVRYVLISVLWPNPDLRGIGAEHAFFRDVVDLERIRLRVEIP